MSFQLTPELVKSNPGLHIFADQELSRSFAEMEALIQQSLGVPTHIKNSTMKSFMDSSFIDVIALVEMHRKFTFPNMKQFEGTTDPNDNIAQYKQRMFTAVIPRDLKEACMCKAFGSSFSGPALQ